MARSTTTLADLFLPPDGPVQGATPQGPQPPRR